jgi:predicted transposase YdaD
VSGAELRAVDHLDSPNIVARLTLPTMAFAPEEKLEVIAAATRGLTELEPDPNRRLKYADFIDIYAMLTDDERERYHQHYPEEAATMAGFSQRFTEIGRQQGLEQGLEQGLSRGRREGEARVIVRLLARRVGPLGAAQVSRVEGLSVEALEALAEGLLGFTTPDELDRWLDSHG